MAGARCYEHLGSEQCRRPDHDLRLTPDRSMNKGSPIDRTREAITSEDCQTVFRAGARVLP